MTVPRFLTLAEVLELHAEQIDLYGGEVGIREIPLLESALAMPQAGIGGEYLHADVFSMAAAYLYHLVMNHPFVDGNKRIGLAAAYVFLGMNGYAVECDPDVLADMVLAVARGETGKEEIAVFFKEKCGTIDAHPLDNSPMWAEAALPTEPLTLNFTECPSVGVGSSLSAILQDNVPEMYSLSPEACRGILRRAFVRGKALPEPLLSALIAQSSDSPTKQAPPLGA